MKKFKSIYLIINTYFNVLARPQHIGTIINITKCKRDICKINTISIDKNYIYQSIPIITRRSVLVILSIINTFIKVLIYITFKILYIHYLHLLV